MSTVVIAPELQKFLEIVRAELSDLDPEEQREITDGLVADLTELIDDQGIEALGDPVAYAAELRQAAGLDDSARSALPARMRIAQLLDASHDRVKSQIAKLPWDVDPLLSWLRPTWWIVRAWVAVQLIAAMTGSSVWSGNPLVPSLGGWGLPVLLALAFASIQLGRGRIWPGEARGVVARLVLLGLNVFAVAMVPVVIAQVESGSDSNYWEGYSDGHSNAYAESVDSIDGDALALAGKPVGNIYPYDAAGNPLVGIQLFDQAGTPLQVRGTPECVYEGPEEMLSDSWRVLFPWSDGASQKRNVFPLPSRLQGSEKPIREPDSAAFAGTDRPTVSGFPFASVPKVSLPGLSTSSATTPAQAFVPGARTGPINPIDNGC